ncbi:MAG: GntR family transcriptional regulator [Pseudonocardiaceae bacterium]
MSTIRDAPDSEPGLRVVKVAQPLKAQVLNRLRRAIVEQRLPPGQRLVERELIEQTGVSRATLREALSQLAAEGLVTTTANKGTTVASITRKQAEELYELRAVLEGMAARQFTQRATPTQRRQLRKAADKVQAATTSTDTLDAFMVAKVEFYRVLFAGAQNTTLQEIVERLQARVSVLRRGSLAQPGRVPQSAAELRTIVDAIESGDPERAADAAAHHVRSAATVILGTLN